MFNRILVPVDGSAPSQHALEMAMGLARTSGAPLRLVHVVDQAAYWTGYDPAGAAGGHLLAAVQESARRVLEDAAATVRQAGLQADTVLVDGLGAGGRLADAIAEAASSWGADLIVVGTHGRRGPSRLLLGSGAEQIIRLSPVPVLVTRGPAEAAAA
jgi:nucleotide-binding universal stress UspA family protein